jgi:hypothetical protein
MTNPINAAHSGAVVISGSAGIRWAQFLARRALLKMQARGLKRTGRQASVICKEAYNLTGRRVQALLYQMDAIYDEYSTHPQHFIIEYPADRQHVTPSHS